MNRAIQRNNPSYRIETVSSVYADVNDKLGRSWYDCNNWEISPTSSPEGYEIGKLIGGGKYSDVFIGYKNDTKYAFKILKPVRPQKYKREVKILQNLTGGPNIVRLEDIVFNPMNNQYTLVLEYVKNCDYSQLFSSFTDKECRFYLYQIMRALEYSHSHGIMHRDLKPQNIVYDREHSKVRLIDWGLAEFYRPKQRYNIHVASRYYKPIELLVDYQCYDYSVDIWSFGVTMAGIIFNKKTFFNGEDDFDMVVKISEVLGRQDLDKYLEKYDIPLPKELKMKLGETRKKNLYQMASKVPRQDLISKEAIDLIERCLKYDHTQRITASQALDHPYFDPVRNIPAN